MNIFFKKPKKSDVLIYDRQSISFAKYLFKKKKFITYDVRYESINLSLLLKTLIKSGIDQFDVASIEEVKAVRKFSQTAKCSYMHTVKSRESISEAYFKYGIKTFALDTKDELIKIIESTSKAKDLELFIRVSVSNEHAEIDYLKNLAL